jgi:integrase
MANLGRKDGIYHIRFRFRTKEYKKSLKVRDRAEAEAAKRAVELTVHRLLTGQAVVPDGVDPGDFILSGGTLTEPAACRADVPSLRDLVSDYLAVQRSYLAESTHGLFTIHLNHVLRHFGRAGDERADRVTHEQLDRYLRERITLTSEETAAKERRTLIHLFKWALAQKKLMASPAAALPVIKGAGDRGRFRTLAEIQGIIERGGLSEEEILSLWECLYLTPQEIADLLKQVRASAREPESFLLHAVPAYTGMRRGEVLRLTWLDIDLDGGFVCARSRKQSRTKKETIRTIDLHPELRDLLARWRRDRPRGQHVLSGPGCLGPINPDRANRLFWQPLRDTEWCLEGRRNWFKIGFHTYRHSFASNLAAAGVDQRLIDEFMGHSTEAMRRRYRHLFPKARRAAIESLSFAVGASRHG